MKRKVGFSLALMVGFVLANCVTKAHSEGGSGAKVGKGEEILVVEDLRARVGVSPPHVVRKFRVLDLRQWNRHRMGGF